MDVAAGKTLEAEIQDSKPLSIISNGVLKRHHHTAFNNYQDGGCTGGGVVVYKECLKNHAASLGAHAVDGCGEFMPSPASNPADPTSLKCAACGCHRNFHRQESDDALTSTVPSSNSTLAIEYQPHHRHHPPPPPPPPPPAPAGSHSSPSSESPPPISSSYYPSAPHLLLTLSGGIAAAAATHQDHLTPPGGSRSAPVVSHSNGRKRFRTRFTQDQKGKMLEFAEKLDWKMQKKDEGLITGFCNEIGVEKGVFKVWMHNNKNYPGGGGGGGKSSSIPIPSTINTNSCSATTYNGNNNGVEIAQQNHDKDINDHFQEQNRHQHDDSFSGRVVAPYGSSTSS